MKEFFERINSALEKNKAVVFSSNCEIKYSGRAESFLPAGDRVVIIKPDKTLLVHQPSGSAPVNYMKENSVHKLVMENNELFLRSKNLPLKEYMDIKINSMHFVQECSMDDGERIQLSGSEKDMSDMIYSSPLMIEEGFRPLSREEHTRFGFIDVFGYDRDNNLVVVECKRYCADLKAVSQLRRYVEKVKKAKGLDNVRGILAAPKITPNAGKMLSGWGFEFRMVKPPKYHDMFDKKQKKLGDY